MPVKALGRGLALGMPPAFTPLPWVCTPPWLLHAQPVLARKQDDPCPGRMIYALYSNTHRQFVCCPSSPPYSLMPLQGSLIELVPGSLH